MIPRHQQIAWGSAARFGIAALFAVAAQFILSPSSLANPGDLYVTDLASGSVIDYAPDGSSTVFATGLVSPQGIAFDQAKNLYVVDAGDGSAGNGTIFKYDLASKTRSVLIGGLSNPIGLALDASDMLVCENGLNRVVRVPTDGVHPPSLFKVVTGPLGISSHAFGTASPVPFNRFIANGPEVLKVTGDGTTTDIDPNDGSRATEVSTVTISGVPSEVVFVSTDSGSITRLVNDVKTGPLATGILDPRGMAFRPGLPIGMEPGGDLFVADGAGSEILDVNTSGMTVFATGGEPNFMVFETGTPTPTPSPTPTVSPTPTPTPSPSPTASPSPTPAPTPTPPAKLLNISTRVDVEMGDDVAIGGFIITGGTTPKTVAIRAIGPSLALSGVSGTLADPVITLHKPDGTTVTNNDWKTNSTTDQGTIVANGLNMYNGSLISDLESIIIATLEPVDSSVPGSGQYTAVMSGNDGDTGVGLVEVYDLDNPSVPAELANISTRGIVGTVDDVLIGGVIVGPSGGTSLGNATVVVRALGPSLANAVPPITDALADPFLMLFNGNGDQVASNDNWADDPNATEIQTLGLAPDDSLEAATLANLIAGNYTAVVMGNNAGIGVALVEIYHVPTETTAH
ncbi:MAG: hypothetical protein ACREIF_00950 [Chthoniobacterales bacterium]